MPFLAKLFLRTSDAQERKWLEGLCGTSSGSTSVTPATAGASPQKPASPARSLHASALEKRVNAMVAAAKELLLRFGGSQWDEDIQESQFTKVTQTAASLERECAHVGGSKRSPSVQNCSPQACLLQSSS